MSAHKPECECEECIREAEHQDFILSSKYEEQLHDSCKETMQRLAKELAQAQQALEDYKDVDADHKRLVREIDVLLNGEAGAAKQASLCDMVAQIVSMKTSLTKAQQERDEARKEIQNRVIGRAINDIGVDEPAVLMSEKSYAEMVKEHRYTMKALKTASDDVVKLESQFEQLQVQLAGCLTAAEGGTQDVAKQGDYGWSLAYQRTLNLYATVQALRGALKSYGKHTPECRMSGYAPEDTSWISIDCTCGFSAALEQGEG